MQTYEIQGFTLAIATATNGPTESIMLELSHGSTEAIATATLSADTRAADVVRAEPCDHCCEDCANRAAVARARAIG